MSEPADEAWSGSVPDVHPLGGDGRGHHGPLRVGRYRVRDATEESARQAALDLNLFEVRAELDAAIERRGRDRRIEECLRQGLIRSQ
jgi:hypothetical protein